MKKTLQILIASSLLLSCSLRQANMTQSAISFAESSGKIEITIKNGQWSTIKSSGFATLLMDNDNAIEQAMNVATLRAKANLVEFLESEIKSTKSTEAFTNSIIRDSGEDKSTASDIATKVSEKIVSESKGILKGVYVQNRKVSDDRKSVIVTIIADKNIINSLRVK